MWYKFIKTSQVWAIDEATDFSEIMYKLHEMYYKYTTIAQSGFSGHEKRRENILAKIEESFYDLLGDVLEPLQNTFRIWLENHALTNASDWGRSRVFDMYGEHEYNPEDHTHNTITSILNEYAKYSNPDEYKSKAFNPYSRANYLDSKFKDIVRIVDLHLGEMPETRDLLESFSETWHMNEVDMYESEDEEYKNETPPPEPYTLSFSEFVEYAGIGQMDSIEIDFYNVVSQYSANIMQVLSEIYQVAVFPFWLEYWQEQGIQDTRNNVEEYYKLLSSLPSNDIHKDMRILTLSLNVMHQNGSMLDYLHDYGGIEDDFSKKDLDYLHNNARHIEWNKELREIGVNV